MSRESRVFLNTSILAVQSIVINVVTIFAIGFIARRLGKQDYGVYALAFAFPDIFEYIGSLGLRPLAMREIARDREHAVDYLGKVVPARAVLIFLMAVTIFISAVLLKYETKILYAIIIAIGSTVCEQFSRIILDVFQSFEEMGKIAFRDITVRLFTAIMSISMLLLGYGLYAVCLAYLGGSIIGLIINVWMYRRRFAFPKMRIEYQFLRDSFKESSGFVLSAFAAALYAKIGILLISKLENSASLGLYIAASNLFSRLDFIADAISSASFPAICELYRTNREQANAIFNKAFLPTLVLSLPIAIGGFILARPIITLIYGSSYIESARVFSILILMTPITFLMRLLVSSLNAANQQRYVAMAISVATVAGLIISYLFINWIGYIGAAVAYFLMGNFLLIILFYGSRRYYRYDLSFNTIISIFVSLICLGCITYMTSRFGIFIAIPLAAAVYYACLKVAGQLTNTRLFGRLL